MNGAASSPPVKRRKTADEEDEREGDNGCADEAGKTEGVRGETSEDKETEKQDDVESENASRQEEREERDGGEKEASHGKEEEMEVGGEDQKDVEMAVRGGGTQKVTSTPATEKKKPIHPFFSETPIDILSAIICDSFFQPLALQRELKRRLKRLHQFPRPKKKS